MYDGNNEQNTLPDIYEVCTLRLASLPQGLRDVASHFVAYVGKECIFEGLNTECIIASVPKESETK